MTRKGWCHFNPECYLLDCCLYHKCLLPIIILFIIVEKIKRCLRCFNLKFFCSKSKSKSQPNLMPSIRSTPWSTTAETHTRKNLFPCCESRRVIRGYLHLICLSRVINNLYRCFQTAEILFVIIIIIISRRWVWNCGRHLFNTPVPWVATKWGRFLLFVPFVWNFFDCLTSIVGLSSCNCFQYRL